MHDILEAFEAHIDDAGLDEETATEELGWKIIEDASKLDPSFLALAAFIIPYFKSNGSQLRGFLRVRYLEELPKGFGLRDKAPPRYAQRKGSEMQIYLPPISETPWRKIFKDTKRPLLITEGEKKSAAATFQGLPCIGLSGVWNFRDPLTKELLKPLREVQWEERKVYIAFDSDLLTKPEVRSALVELSKTLTQAGAIPRVVRLPTDDPHRNGLDDYLKDYGKPAFLKLMEAAEDIVQSAELERYNHLFCVIQHPPEIRSLGNLDRSWSLASPAGFVNAFNQDLMRVFDGKGQVKMAPVAKHWIDWSHRGTAAATTFEPEKPFPLCTGADMNDQNETLFNLWRGWGVDPKRGPTDIWRKLLHGVFGGRTAQIKWFEQWLAYPIQNPGAKLYQAVFIWGTGQGTGKSSIGKFMLKIYGPHGRELSDDAFESNFNGWLENTSFVLADDLSSEHPKQLKSNLKRLIASDDIEVRRMYLDSYKAKNHCQFLFTAQTSAAIPLDENANRRYFIIRAPDDKPHAEDWYTGEMDAYLKGEGPAFVRYRLERIDLSDFRPHGDAPSTPDNEETVAASAPEIGLWLMSLKQDPEGWLKERGLPEDLEVITGDQLLVFAKQGIENVRARLVLRDAAKVFTRLGQTSPFKDGSRPVFYAFKNAAHYKGHVSRAKRHFLERFPM